jgi:hypothetical protein
MNLDLMNLLTVITSGRYHNRVGLRDIAVKRNHNVPTESRCLVTLIYLSHKDIIGAYLRLNLIALSIETLI